MNADRMQGEIGQDILKAGERIREGRLVAFPTETVYGLGANALNPDAVARIFEAKGRPHFDPLIVHVKRLADLEALVSSFPETATRLAERFWPGPLTLVLPKTSLVPDLVTSGLPTVAVRIPRHPVAQQLLEAAGVPIAAPSANRFGRLSPTTAAHVCEQLGERIDYILDGGPCDVGVESTVLDLTTNPPRLLRPGGVALEDLVEVIGDIATASQIRDCEIPAAPGMLTQHYAPRTRVVVIDSWDQCPVNRSQSALLTLAPINERDQAAFLAVETLSPTGDLREAATKFFATMRWLDDAGAEQIIALRFPHHGLGRALNDRLERAAKSSEG